MDIWQIIKLWQASISASIKWLYLICLPSLIDLGSKLDDHYYYYSFKLYLLLLSGYNLLLFDSAADGRKASVVLTGITRIRVPYLVSDFGFRIFNFSEWKKCKCILKNNHKQKYFCRKNVPQRQWMFSF